MCPSVSVIFYGLWWAGVLVDCLFHCISPIAVVVKITCAIITLSFTVWHGLHVTWSRNMCTSGGCLKTGLCDHHQHLIRFINSTFPTHPTSRLHDCPLLSVSISDTSPDIRKNKLCQDNFDCSFKTVEKNFYVKAREAPIGHSQAKGVEKQLTSPKQAHLLKLYVCTVPPHKSRLDKSCSANIRGAIICHRWIPAHNSYPEIFHNTNQSKWLWLSLAHLFNLTIVQIIASKHRRCQSISSAWALGD